MTGSSLFDDNINGVLDENFDDIFRIFDFPLEDVEGNVGVEDWNVKFQGLEQPSFDFLTSYSYGPSPKNGNDALKFPNINDAVKFPEVVNISALVSSLLFFFFFKLLFNWSPAILAVIWCTILFCFCNMILIWCTDTEVTP